MCHFDVLVFFKFLGYLRTLERSVGLVSTKIDRGLWCPPLFASTPRPTFSNVRVPEGTHTNRGSEFLRSQGHRSTLRLVVGKEVHWSRGLIGHQKEEIWREEVPMTNRLVLRKQLAVDFEAHERGGCVGTHEEARIPGVAVAAAISRLPVQACKITDMDCQLQVLITDSISHRITLYYRA